MSDEPLLPEGFEWAVVEIFGHRKHAGRAREEERFGAKMLRIDVPTIALIRTEGQPAEVGGVETWTTHWYGGASLFSFTLTDEASVMRANRPYVPAQRYIAPPDRYGGDAAEDVSLLDGDLVIAERGEDFAGLAGAEAGQNGLPSSSNSTSAKLAAMRDLRAAGHPILSEAGMGYMLKREVSHGR